MNSHQRTEITNVDALQEDETLGVDHKSHVSIHDHLPAIKPYVTNLKKPVERSAVLFLLLVCYFLSVV